MSLKFEDEMRVKMIIIGWATEEKGQHNKIINFVKDHPPPPNAFKIQVHFYKFTRIKLSTMKLYETFHICFILNNQGFDAFVQT